MNAAATLQPDTDLSSAYINLEPQIRDLVQMAELARYYVSNPPVTCKADAERVCFAISHIADMANDLEKAYDRGILSGREVRT